MDMDFFIIFASWDFNDYERWHILKMDLKEKEFRFFPLR